MADSRPAIVILVAHPDDVAFDMGGTAFLLKDKYKLHVLCASRGERGYEWKGKGLPPPNHQVGATRAKEEAESCALLGADLTFLDQDDSEIFAGRQVCEKTAELLGRLKPVALFTHWALEKPDHAAVWGIAWKALHLSDRFWETEFYMTAMACDDRNGPKPDVYVNISSVFEQKMKLVGFHKSHAEHWSKYLTLYNSILGKQAWCEYAEAFATGLPLMGSRWNRKAGCLLLDLAADARKGPDA